MRIIFAGTPEFASLALKALIDSGMNVVAVYTQPDRPAGRGLKLHASSVKKLAVEHQLDVYQPLSLKDPQALQQLKSLHADVMVVAAYGLLLPEEVLKLPKFGCINIHASLLPRWRGAAPINRAIEAGDKKTGITIMQMDKGLDTGNMLLKKSCDIEEQDTANIVHDRLAKLGAEAIVEYLQRLEQQGPEDGEKQDENLANYAKKLNKKETSLDWEQGATDLANKIRALSPWPVASTYYQNKPLKIWLAHAIAESHSVPAGTIVALHKDSIDVNTGKGILRITQVQRAGSKAIAVKDFLNGTKMTVGEQFTDKPTP